MNDREETENAEVVNAGQDAHAPAVADDVLPETLYLMPVPNRPFFPGQVQPVAINPRDWGSTLEAVGETGQGLIGLSYVDHTNPESLEPRNFPEIGCVVRLHRPRVSTRLRQGTTCQLSGNVRSASMSPDQASWGTVTVFFVFAIVASRSGVTAVYEAL